MIKEWACLEHGAFEASHAICPAFGCDSAHVTQEFRTPVGIKSAWTKRSDAGLRKSSDMYGISNFRSARPGEAAYGGDKARELGQEVLWGNDIQRKMGHSFSELTSLAAKPLVVNKRDGSGQVRLERNNAMREAATELGITRRRVPHAAEVSGAADTPKERAKSLTA
jgi:hypothetical protein